MLSDDLDKSLSGIERFKMKVHLMMCKYCREYGDQLKLTSKTIEQVMDKADDENLVNGDLRKKLLEEFKSIHGCDDCSDNDCHAKN